jgi:predicted NBD/HSP70 family sugar kinase
MTTAATPSTLRRLNRRSVIQYLLDVPAVSRAELAKAIGTSPVTAGKIVDELTAEHVLETVDNAPETKSVGRPGQLFRLDATRPRFLAVQLGVTHTRAGLTTLGFRQQDTWDVQFDTPQSAEEWAEKLQKTAGKLLNAKLWGILISTPGIVDQTAQRVIFSPNLHWTEKQDFRALLRPLHSAPAFLIQEIQALALGEMVTRTDVKDFLLVDFSHGLGGAAVIGGQLLKTVMPFNSELGHTRVLGNDRMCGCGAVGCVETLVSRRGLFQSISTGRGQYQWEKVVKHIQDNGLEPWLKTALTAAADAIGSALNVLGLQNVTITGSISDLPTAVATYLIKEIENATLSGRFGTVYVRTSPRNRVRGLIKAGLEAFVLGSDLRSR